MYLASVTNDRDNITDYDTIPFTNCINTENEDVNFIFAWLLLSISSSILLFSSLSLMVYTLTKLLFKNFRKIIYNYTCIYT